ncbi:MAG: AAA family ATPase [Candidatus Spyradenecus sp.]
MVNNINVQNWVFPQIRESGSIYVDKTDYFYSLVKPGPSDSRVFFLARLRRFGKSLMISTLKAIFQGKRELFEGLAIAKEDYDWQPWPVLHFDLSLALGVSYEEIETSFNNMANNAFKAHPGFSAGASGKDNFTNVLEAYEAAGKRVVILIDEYDALICHTLNDPEKCEKVRQLVGNFYAVMKGHQAAIRFAMITGISKFASLAIFSGLNNIVDLTYDPAYATLYLHDGRPIALVGLSFHKGQRELQGVAYEVIPAPQA